MTAGVPMQTIGLVPHRDRPVAHKLAHRAATWLTDHGCDVRVPASLTAASSLDAYAVDDERFADGLDLAISLGGDGTMLEAVQLVYPAPVPLLGVNVGILGYLTELEPEQLDDWLPRLVAGDFAVSERTMLAVDVESAGSVRGSWYALNETVVEKLRSGHLIYIDVSINGSAFTSYAADGLIVSAARSCRPTCAARCSRRSLRTCSSTARSCCRSTTRSP
jgi:NAD+ kinase